MTGDPSANRTTVTFHLNGTEVSVPREPERKLVTVLREELGLTGTKEGCSEGTCGSCTVLLDGRAVKSCVTSLDRVAGREVETIEGIGTREHPHPLQKAFVTAGAIQCGYCTPGMIMRAKALLDVRPHPTRGEIAESLSPSLCRCTGYKKTVDAVQSAAAASQKRRTQTGSAHDVPTPAGPAQDVEQVEAGPAHPGAEVAPMATGAAAATAAAGAAGLAETPGRWVGRSVEQVGVWEKALGLTKYAADLTPEGCSFLKVVRSDRPHALIRGITLDEALQIPGVLAIFTANDVAGTNRVGPIQRDQAVLAGDKVRFVGDAVALVAADTPQAAEAGASAVKVHYEDLPALISPDDSLSPDTPLIHETGNVLADLRLQKGDTCSALSTAAAVVEEVFYTPFHEHTYIETEAGVAWPDGERIVIRQTTQNPHEIREQVATALGLEPERLRIVQAPTGGSFGGKMNAQLPAYLALAVLRLGRPVKLVYTRSESMTVTEKRHAFRMALKGAADADGRLVVLEADLVADGGAYASYGKAVAERALIHASGPYEIPNVSVRSRVVYTNVTPAGAMRGFGAPQVSFAIESVMDMLAEKLGLDPVEIRRRNILRLGSTTATGQLLTSSVGALATLEALRPYYDEAAEWARQKTEPGTKRGLGLASIFFGISEGGWRDPARIGLRIAPHGKVQILAGAADLGQGVFSVLRQIAADASGLPLDAFEIVTPDTDATPDAGPTEASRQTIASGTAVQRAAEAMRQNLSDLRLGGDPVGQWQSWLADAHDVLRDLGLPLEYEGYFEPANQPIDKKGQGVPHETYAFASHLAQVEVDEKTGRVRVVRLVAAHDVGTPINPLALDAQFDGGIAMGLGGALTEEYLPGETTKLSQYKIPRAKDVPQLINLLVSEPYPGGPYGAKGMGESPTVGPASAVANAVASATGTRPTRLPVTPPRRTADVT